MLFKTIELVKFESNSSLYLLKLSHMSCHEELFPHKRCTNRKHIPWITYKRLIFERVSKVTLEELLCVRGTINRKRAQKRRAILYFAWLRLNFISAYRFWIRQSCTVCFKKFPPWSSCKARCQFDYLSSINTSDEFAELFWGNQTFFFFVDHGEDFLKLGLGAVDVLRNGGRDEFWLKSADNWYLCRKFRRTCQCPDSWGFPWSRYWWWCSAPQGLN